MIDILPSLKEGDSNAATRRQQLVGSHFAGTCVRWP